MLNGICERHSRIEVSARNWAERQDECYQRRARRDGVRESCRHCLAHVFEKILSKERSK